MNLTIVILDYMIAALDDAEAS